MLRGRISKLLSSTGETPSGGIRIPCIINNLFHTLYYLLSFSRPPDYTKGVFQTLGFKEFHDYLMLSDEERNSDTGKKLLEQSIENMKMGTRRYAHRQKKMIRGRFLEHPTREVSKFFMTNKINGSNCTVHL